jgi:hypothetical protein
LAKIAATRFGSVPAAPFLALAAPFADLFGFVARELFREAFFFLFIFLVGMERRISHRMGDTF